MKGWINLTLVLFLAACSPTQPSLGSAVKLTISSPAFNDGGSIPARYTCQGDDLSPELKWENLPRGTQSLALIVDDPDAPGTTWVHWIVYNLPANIGGLVEGASQGNARSFELPDGAIQGVTSFGRNDYGGPCPPSGQHHYHFKLYALDVSLEGSGLDKAGLLKAMDGHILAQSELVGLYEKN
jgi:Raf kinase inhibitor-like YbhB/YbcL family protein